MLTRFSSLTILACSLACAEKAPVALNWPASAGIAPDSLARVYQHYFGQVPRAVGGCGARHLALRFTNVPGDLLRSGIAPMSSDAGVVRARVGVATTLAVLAWNAVEAGDGTDTITIALLHPDGFSGQYTFVRGDGASYLQPLRLIEGAGNVCPLPT